MLMGWSIYLSTHHIIKLKKKDSFIKFIKTNLNNSAELWDPIVKNFFELT